MNSDAALGRRPLGELARAVVDAAAIMALRGLVVSTVGNVSVRCDDTMVITPSRRYFDELTPGDLVSIPLRGVVHGRTYPGASREWAMHREVYRGRPDVGAIAHTHSPFATARSFVREDLEFVTEERLYFDIERVPVLPWTPGGSVELAVATAVGLGTGRAALLERHGVVAVGRSPRDAVELACVIEHQAQVHWLAAQPCGQAVRGSTINLTSEQGDNGALRIQGVG